MSQSGLRPDKSVKPGHRIKTLWYNLGMPYKDYNAQMNRYMKDRWAKRRSAAIEHLGGKCARCDITDELEFDHIDPNTKTMTVARAASRNEEFFWNEVNKCQLLCQGHHLIKSGEDRLNGVYKNRPRQASVA